MEIIKQLIWGFAFGVANIIPGVSGGTFALVLGFYTRLLKAIEGLNSQAIKELLQILIKMPGDMSSGMQSIKAWMKEKDFYFLIFLGLGAVLSIFSLSALMKYLLVHQFAPTYAYFFGLITLSVIVPWKLIKKKSMGVILCVILGCVATVGVTIGVDPVAKAESKSKLYEQRLKQSQLGSSVDQPKVEAKAFSWTGKYTQGEIIMAGVSGSIAISAMVLPGISGSLILILLGQYMLVIQAISSLRKLYLDDIVFLSVMALGMFVGLILTAKLVRWALDTIHDQTMGLLTGLILGSLFVLWPFRASVTKDLYQKVAGEIQLNQDVVIYTNHVELPSFDMPGILCLAMILLGMGSMVFFLKNDPEAN